MILIYSISTESYYYSHCLNFQDGSVALHLACVRGFVDVADVLLTYGANVDVNHLQVFCMTFTKLYVYFIQVHSTYYNMYTLSK